jgi:hypothetical protein
MIAPNYDTVSSRSEKASAGFVKNENQGLTKNSGEDNSAADLRKQLVALENEYNAYFKVQRDKVQNYFDRVDPKKDSYLNTNVIFENGASAYVTNQGVVKTYPNGEFNNMKGKNGCPTSSRMLKTNDVTKLSPHLKNGTSMIQNQQCGNEGKNIVVSSVLPSNMPDPTYKGCYAANSNQKMSYIDITGKPTTSLPGKEAQIFTYDDCKTSAVYNGYRYFGIQNAGPNGRGLGYCAVSNSIVPFTTENTSYMISGITALWTSKLPKGTGKTAEFSNTGALTIKNSKGVVVFSTQYGNDYLGCFLDNRSDGRNLPNGVGNGFTYDTCKQKAVAGNYTYFGLQNESSYNSSGPKGTQSECWLGNDKDYNTLINNPKYPQINSNNSRGGFYNCHLPSNKKDTSGKLYGGPSVNAVYSVNPIGTYYLIVKDDGMGIYKGENIPPSRTDYVNPNDKRIWNVPYKTTDPDPQYAASKSKYGNCLVVGKSTPSAVLNIGDFIGSLSGKAYLKMESDGNLVLYTSTRKVNCNLDNQKHTVGGVGANAVYDITKTGVPQDLGMAGFVDENSILHQYPSSMVTYPKSNSNYVTKPGNPVSITPFNIASYTVTGNMETSIYKSLAQAQKVCNNNPKCNSILKSDIMFYLMTNKYGEPTEQDNKAALTTYYRVPQVNSSDSCPKGFMEVDSLTWERYKNNGGGLGSQMSSKFDCTFGQANITEDSKLLDLKRNIDNLRRQILEKTKSWSGRSHVANKNHGGNKVEDGINASTHGHIANNKALEDDESARKILRTDVKEKQIQAIKNSKNMKSKNPVNSKEIKTSALYNKMKSKKTGIDGFTNMNSVINRIVNDSSLQVSQRNYEYILWIVLAIIAIAICIRVYRVKAKT